MKEIFSFYKGKRILITGHTGFKGTWMCKELLRMGAEVFGYALEAPTDPSLFELLGMSKKIESVIGDVRDADTLLKYFQKIRPEIVIHMAAQPIVSISYKSPVYTYETNVMGTVNVLECIRKTECVRSFVNVTTDKVYHNREWCWGYRESDKLNGYDPYSNSKSCSELVTSSYRNSFLEKMGVAVSSARSGNVIGGGDFAVNRIIPDCVRAAFRKEKIRVRNPQSVRPYQHVLEPISAYLMIAERQYKDMKYAGDYNIGPNESSVVTTGELVSLFCREWKEELLWEAVGGNGPHEANYLKLECSKIKSVIGWHPTWSIKQAVGKTVEWSKALEQGRDIEKIIDIQMDEYFDDYEKIRI